MALVRPRVGKDPEGQSVEIRPFATLDYREVRYKEEPPFGPWISSPLLQRLILGDLQANPI